MDCKENRKFDMNDIPDKLPEEAWAILKKASDEKDLEDFREVQLQFYDLNLFAPANDAKGTQGLFQGGSAGNFRGHREENA